MRDEIDVCVREGVCMFQRISEIMSAFLCVCLIRRIGLCVWVCVGVGVGVYVCVIRRIGVCI